MVNPRNAYSALRLARYQTGRAGDWARLPVFNPPTEPIPATIWTYPPVRLRRRCLRRPRLSGYLPTGPRWTTTRSSLSAGRLSRAIRPNWPLHAGGADVASGGRAVRAVGRPGGRCRGARARADARRIGVAGGHVRDLSHRPRRTDAGSSTDYRTPPWTSGAPSWNRRASPPAASSDPRAAWGPGRLDVSTTAGTEPARIPDLRPVRWLTHLHQDATLRGSDPVTLAMRLETLIITANSQTVRPPRIVTLALAAYVRSLGDGLPAPEAAAAASPDGAKVFAASCAECHAAPGFTGPPVALSAIGTDPTLGRSADRGTGTYRVPSLRGVGSRGRCSTTARSRRWPRCSIRGGSRRSFDGRLHGTGPVRGHVYGLTLPERDRRSLLTYLQRL